MLRRIVQISFGLGVGVLVRLLLPGHASIGVASASTVSLAGALGGGWAAEPFMPADAAGPAGFAVSAIGALAALLLYGLGT